MLASQDIEVVWARFEAWLRAVAPSIAGNLRPPASEAALAAAEADMGRALPGELRRLLQVHDGGDEVIGHFDLMSAASIADAHQSTYQLSQKYGSPDDVPQDARGLLDPEGRAGWIPFVSTAGGSYLCADVAPGPDGTVGQVFYLAREGNAEPPWAPSLTAWLARIVACAEAGEVSYDAARQQFLPFYGACGFSLAFRADPPVRLDAARRETRLRGPRTVALRSVETAGPLPTGCRIELVQAGTVVHEWDVDAAREDEESAIVTEFHVLIEDPGPWTPIGAGTLLRAEGLAADDTLWVTLETGEATA